MLLGKAGLPVVELWGFHDGWACFLMEQVSGGRKRRATKESIFVD